MSDKATPPGDKTEILSSKGLEAVRLDLEQKVEEAKRQKERQLQGKLSDRAGSIKGAFTVAGLLREAEEAKKFYDDVKAAGEVPEDFDKNYRRILETIEELERQYEANDAKQKELSEVPEVQERIREELEKSKGRLTEKANKREIERLIKEVQNPDLTGLKEALLDFHKEDMEKRQEVRERYEQLNRTVQENEELKGLIESLQPKNNKPNKINDPYSATNGTYMPYSLGAPNQNNNDLDGPRLDKEISHYETELGKLKGITKAGPRKTVRRIIGILESFLPIEIEAQPMLKDYIEWREKELRYIYRGPYAEVLQEGKKKIARLDELEAPKYQGMNEEGLKETIRNRSIGRNYIVSIFSEEEAKDDALRQTAYYFANTICKEPLE
jgi:hypothetical protein